jgi:hypothetical protein
MRHFELLVLGLAAGCASATGYRELPLAETAPAEPIAAPSAPVPGGDLQSMVASMPVAADPAAAAQAAQAKPAGDDPGGPAPEYQRFQPPYREDRLIGPNAQPEWTTERRFVTAKTYVLPPGQIELEQWARVDTPKGEAPRWLWQTGAGIGIENRMQFDVYENYTHEDGVTQHDAVQMEGRYAFGRWDRYAGNPAIGLEYRAEHDAPDFAEVSLLLADDFRQYGWRWTANVFFGGELSGVNTVEWGASGGLSKMLIDSQLSIGIESRFRNVSIEDHRSDGENELLVGPSLQWRPTENTHLDFVPLFGFSHSDRDQPRMEVTLVFGIDIGQPRRDTIKPDGSTIK